MKKSKFLITLSICLMLIVLVLSSFYIFSDNNQNEMIVDSVKAEILEKEIEKIETSVEYNSATIIFEDGTTFDSNLNKFFFTETAQKEYIIKDYDENQNLSNVRVLYNPETTIIN